MRKMLYVNFIFAFLLSFLTVFADNEVKINKNGKTGSEVNLISTTASTTTIQFSVNSYTLKEVKTPQGQAFVVNIQDGTKILEKGAPDLAKLSTSIIIPDKSEMQIEVIASEYIEVNYIEIAPSKGNFTRDIDPASVAYTYGDVYKQDKLFPSSLTQLRDPFIIRDYRGQSVIVNPFQYNPVSKVLRIYTDITVKVSATNKQGINEITRTKALTSLDSEYKQVYNQHFLNFVENSKYTPVEEIGSMLIISDPDYMAAMQPYIDWKIQKGIPVEMVDVATAGGSAAAIKTYVEQYYNNNEMAFLLLVGDGGIVPTNSGTALGGESDNAYGYILGDDHYQEILVGRFSAESVQDVETQVQRTLDYEMNPSITEEWFSRTIGIASSQGPGDDDEFDYEHIRNMQIDLIDFTYVEPTIELFDGSQGGNDASGDPTPAMVGTDVDAGASIILYTGHGSTTSWGSSGFSNTNVNNLNNVGMLPFIWSVACVNGNFVGATCFAEAWMRANDGTNPTGAIGFFGSTINQSWDPPMEGQDEMVDILVESYSDNIKRTFGGLSINGCFQMNETYGAGGESMTDTWLIFGDPSLYVRTATPVTMNVSHLDVLFLGMDNYTVTSDIEGALVSLTTNGEILGTGFIESGTTTITFPSASTPGTLLVTVTGFNAIPYIAEVPIIPADGPYVVLDEYTINDASGNNNGLADYGEDILLNVTVVNVGEDPASNVTANITSNDPYVIITDGTENFGDVPANSTVTVNDAFAISIASDIPDQHNVICDMILTDGTDTWNSILTINVNAPILEVDGFVIDDSANGNNDGILDPGETSDIVVTLLNSGNSDAINVETLISTISTDIILNTTAASLNTLAAGTSASAIFNITAADEVPLGTPAYVNFNATSGETGVEYTVEETLTVIVGLIPEYIMENGTISTCVGLFYDSGGPDGEYQNYEDLVLTIMPASAGAMVHANFLSFNTELNYDYLYVYDGVDDSAPQVPGSPFNSTVSPGLIMATNGDGALTFYFYSDVSQTRSGWEAEISCFFNTEPPVCSGNPIPANGAENIIDPVISWDAVPYATSYDVYFGETLPTTVTANVTEAFYTADMTIGTSYEWKIAPRNDNGAAEGCDVWTFNTIGAAPDCATNPFPANGATGTMFPLVLTWDATPNVSSYEVTFNGGAAVMLTEPIFIPEGLIANTLYEWSVVPINIVGGATGCETWTFETGDPLYFMSNGTVTTCEGNFFDSGGPDGQYQDYEDFVMTFMPGITGNMIKAVFTFFDVEGNDYDNLYVHNGVDVSAPELEGSPFSNDNVPDILIANNNDGALTFHFTSDSSVPKDGWAATIECIEIINVAPEFTTTPVTTASIGVEYIYNVEASDANGDNLTFAVTLAPSWLQLENDNDNTATLSGTPTQAGTFDVTITVTDAEFTVEQSFTITVAEAANNAPEITSEAIITGDVGEVYTYEVIAVDPDGDELTYTMNNGPDWLLFDGNVLSGTPLEGGNVDVDIVVSDGDLTATQSWTITVEAALSSAKEITAFNFDGLDPAVEGIFDGVNISLLVPNGTDITALVATFANSDLSTVKIDDDVQESGVTANDFTEQIIYTVHAEDLSTADYTVIVNIDIGIGGTEGTNISIYPNPVNNILNITNAENAKIYVYNVVGEVVASIEKGSTLNTIDMSTFAEGSYIVKILTGDNIITHKVSVVK
jgi:hypothetical protein